MDIATPGRSPTNGVRNSLLRDLPLPEYQKISEALEPVKLRIHQEIYVTDTDIENVYFPETMMISLVTSMKDGTTVEMGIVGRHGMAGLAVFLGASRAPSAAFVQVSGEAWRMPVADFQRTVTPETVLYARLMRYTQAFLVQSGQAAACNALHTVAQRCARWLLMTSDQVGEPSFALTQEFLSQMLGVRRAGVTEAEGALEAKGLIKSSRGTISIVDRKGLERASCECYGIIRRESDRLGHRTAPRYSPK